MTPFWYIWCHYWCTIFRLENTNIPPDDIVELHHVSLTVFSITAKDACRLLLCSRQVATCWRKMSNCGIMAGLPPHPGDHLVSRLGILNPVAKCLESLAVSFWAAFFIWHNNQCKGRPFTRAFTPLGLALPSRSYNS